jgi:hypothetical protein
MSLVSNLIELRNTIDLMLQNSNISGSNGKLTKSGKPRKVSDRKGKPTAHGDFTKMICETMATELAIFKEAGHDTKGSHFTFISNYKKEHPEVWAEFQAKWASEHSGVPEAAEAAEAAEAVEVSVPIPAKAKPVPTPVPLATPVPTPVPVAVATPAPVPVAVATPAPVKKPVKTAKKAAITAEVATALQPAIVKELLPFTFNGNTYLRLGTRSENGNHLWTSGHLWMSKKGQKGHHYGELQDDGTINMDAEEPVI